jgi:hypothetical protein
MSFHSNSSISHFIRSVERMTKSLNMATEFRNLCNEWLTFIFKHDALRTINSGFIWGEFIRKSSQVVIRIKYCFDIVRGTTEVQNRTDMKKKFYSSITFFCGFCLIACLELLLSGAGLLQNHQSGFTTMGRIVNIWNSQDSIPWSDN